MVDDSKDKYNHVWNYHFHVENFMITCTLTEKLDLDFKHNLELNKKLSRVEELVQETDVNKRLENYKIYIKFGKRI
jgi:hypothetical protein